MVKKLILIALAIATKINAQVNLVMNPSFEDSTGTMWQYSNGDPYFYHLCKYWDNPNYASPDYDYNVVGAQHGIAFCGIDLYEQFTSNYREYIQGELSMSLTANNTYSFSFYIRLDTVSEWKLCSLQVAFLTSRQYSAAMNVFSFSSSIDVDITAATTNIWTKCSGTYTAQGGEKYLMIGGMKSDLLTCKSHFSVSPYSDAAYYNIDNISLVETSVGLNNIKKSNSFVKVFPNPVSSVIHIYGESLIQSVEFLDAYGTLVARLEDFYMKDLNIEFLKDGLYTIKIETQEKKVFVQKICIIK